MGCLFFVIGAGAGAIGAKIMCLVLLKTGGYAAETPLQKVTNHKQGSESVNFTHVNFLVSLFA
jgi:hypothetical protein